MRTRPRPLVRSITAVFWDIGGVLLSNGWDSAARASAVERFGLDADEFQARHAESVEALETGKLSLDAYLDRTVFHRPRSFSREAFRRSIYSCSRPRVEALAVAARVSASGRTLMAALNNESLELNLYRIRTWRLTDLFSVFFSSCFLGVRKPDPRIYAAALRITQRDPDECLFVDDRRKNIEAALDAGMRAVLFRGTEHLERDLVSFGIDI